jgi:hypothetical protein
MRKFILIGVLLVIIIVAISVLWKLNQYAKSYSILNVSCVNTTTNDCSLLNFTFKASVVTFKKNPKYSVKEIIEQGQSQIIINGISSIDAQFTYDQIAESPLVEGIDYKHIDNTLILTIDRKGSLAPLEITEKGSTLNIRIPENNETYPKFSNLYPKSDSITNPFFQTISADVVMNSAYKDGFMIIDGQQEKFDVVTKGVNQYSLMLKKNLEKDRVYNIKVIAVDANNRASAVIWEFEAMKLIGNVSLPLDRFKYLGWWGQVNQNEVKIMEGPSTQSKELHVFSTINRVKILEEIRGETIGNNNVWYKIDGGAHPGAFIFSDYVTPVEQPAPPTTFDIPKTVKQGEYWIDVNIAEKILTLFAYDKPIFATYVATGKPANPTITGAYRVWYKLAKKRMQGGPPVVDHYYDLPNVPWVMFYKSGYAIHGTYWHDKFGTQQSAGCTNVTQGDAKFIFEKTMPILLDNTNFVFSSDDNPGTVIHNHY